MKQTKLWWQIIKCKITIITINNTPYISISCKKEHIRHYTLYSLKQDLFVFQK